MSAVAITTAAVNNSLRFVTIPPPQPPAFHFSNSLNCPSPLRGVTPSSRIAPLQLYPPFAERYRFAVLPFARLGQPWIRYHSSDVLAPRHKTTCHTWNLRYLCSADRGSKISLTGKARHRSRLSLDPRAWTPATLPHKLRQLSANCMACLTRLELSTMKERLENQR